MGGQLGLRSGALFRTNTLCCRFEIRDEFCFTDPDERSHLTKRLARFFELLGKVGALETEIADSAVASSQTSC